MKLAQEREDANQRLQTKISHSKNSENQDAPDGPKMDNPDGDQTDGAERQGCKIVFAPEDKDNLPRSKEELWARDKKISREAVEFTQKHILDPLTYFAIIMDE